MRNFADGVEIIIEDFNGLSKDIARELYERTIFEIISRKENAFFSDGFTVGYVNATQVSVNSGVGFLTDNTKIVPEPKKRLIYGDVSQNLTIDPPDATNNRIDIVVTKSTFIDTETDTRKYKDAIDSSISNQNVVVAKDWSNETIIVAGTPSGTPSAPSVPAGYIKLAEIVVTAVSGIAGSGAITDYREIIPVGSKTTINTTGYSRLTVGTAVSLETLMADIDALLKNGYYEYFDVDVLGAHPSAPAASKIRLYYYNGLLYLQDNAGLKTPVGSGGGGGGGLAFSLPEGSAPFETQIEGVEVLQFESGSSQIAKLRIKVPESYVAGRQISMYLKAHSPSSSDDFLINATVGLVRKNQDPIDTPFKTRTTTNTALTNTVANQDRTVALDLTDASGLIDGGAVSAGDTLIVEVKRGSDTDTATVNLERNVIEPVFG